MDLPVTSFYAAVLAVMYVALAVHVIRTRRRLGVALMDQGQDALKRSVRAHGNFAEYVPLGLVLMLLLELQAALDLWLLWALGAALVAGRAAHAYSVLIHEGKQGSYRWRVLGMATTFTVYGISAVTLLLRGL